MKFKFGVDYKPIPEGTNPEDIVRGMKLIYVSSKYKEWKKDIFIRKLQEMDRLYWSGYVSKKFLDDLKKDPTVLAIWEKDGWLVFAWMDMPPKRMSKEEFIEKFGKYLNPEQPDELLGGYYDYSTMRVPDLGITVEVEPYDVIFKGEDWAKLIFEGIIKE